MPAASEPILIVDDDNEFLFMLKLAVGDWGHAVETARNGEEALRLAANRKYKVVLMDMRMKTDREGLETLVALRAGDGPNRRTHVIIMTAYAKVEDAVDALKSGAMDYLMKPFDLKLLRHAIDGAAGRMAVAEDAAPAKAGGPGLPVLIGDSGPFREMKALVEQAAPSEATVLITGESGTGKEMVASMIQRLSPRVGGSFIKINCAALAENLLESELFGHVKGAFTGADSNRDGRLMAANGGTVFLDEVAETSNSFQAKLLRTLQEGEIQPLGSNFVKKVDVRIIAATNKDLEAEVGAGRFREDLYYRLNVIRVNVPPLRERPDDILPLARHFVSQYASKNKKNVTGLDQGAQAAVMAHSWPGNIRELQNAMERAVILAKGELVAAADMSIRSFAPSSGGQARQAPAFPQAGAAYLRPPSWGPSAVSLKLRDSECEKIKEAMNICGGNKTKASEMLGVTRKTLTAKLRKCGLEPLPSHESQEPDTTDD
ncbi:MAG: sigma-54 dependent transcriptional regulator [Deltaproteobacteria bacterium]|jgi:two-component system response regulator HydG|nr:sigma-54 dependent transcriptional regulator [Deltaproteobacteria bacterium]